LGNDWNQRRSRGTLSDYSTQHVWNAKSSKERIRHRPCTKYRANGDIPKEPGYAAQEGVKANLASRFNDLLLFSSKGIRCRHCLGSILVLGFGVLSVGSEKGVRKRGFVRRKTSSSKSKTAGS